MTTPMLTITGANSLLGRALVAAYTPHTSVRAVDKSFDAPVEGAACMAGDLRDAEFAAQAADGANAIIHLAPLYTRFAGDDTLDHATRGTHLLADAAAKAGVARFILGSSLRIYPPALTARYRVDESWRPRTGADLDSLCAWLGEVCTRETVRVTGTPAVCLRLGDVVDDATVAGRPFEPYWLHVSDAIQAIQRALDADLSKWTGWGVLHIGAAGERAALSSARAANEPLRYAPAHDFADALVSQTASLAQPTAVHSRPIKRVVIFGAGGPLATAATTALAQTYTLRLTDVKPIGELLAALTPQSLGAPLPTAPRPPHEWQVADVCDAARVMSACEGMDAIINCTVIRNDLAGAFRVNMLGAWNVMRAAVAHGIQRVVHTGPFMLGDRGRLGYDWDYDIVDDVPPRPGTSWLYFLSKLCGQEIVRAFAEQHGLTVPALTFCDFRNPDVRRDPPLHPLTVSWRDAGQAIRCALEAPALPAPFEYFHIGADLPHGVYHNDKAKRLLGWQPRDAFEDYYLR